MTVTPFKLTDLGAFVPNEYSNPDQILPLLTDSSYEVLTLWGERNLVQAIICFRNYWGRCWNTFVLVAKDFMPANAQLLRELIEHYMQEHRAIRLQTESRATAVLWKWHEFLGFTYEGTKRKMMFNQDYDCWAIVREEA